MCPEADHEDLKRAVGDGVPVVAQRGNGLAAALASVFTHFGAGWRQSDSGNEAARAEDTDWPQILALYELPKRVSPSAVVILNHAIAAAMAHGPSKGLELLRMLDNDPRLAGHYRLNAVRAHLFEMIGDYESAAKNR
jgi:hypothetical protein